MDVLQTVMLLEKETKGAVRYAATEVDPALTTVYIRKTFFSNGQYPKHITVTVAAGDD